MVCSAPEMTTVSKPNKNPASAEVMAQKKMRPFMRPPDELTDVFTVEVEGMFMVVIHLLVAVDEIPGQMAAPMQESAQPK